MEIPMFNELVQVLKNKPIYVVAFGTSLENFPWEQLSDKYTIALNNAARKVPDLSFHLYSDKTFLKRYRGFKYPAHTMLIVQKHIAEKAMNDPECDIGRDRIYGFLRTNTVRLDKIKKDDDKLYMTRTVALPGLMLAWKLGGRPIYLMGHDAYDLKGKTYADGTKQTQKDKEKDLEDGRILRAKHVVWRRHNENLKKYFARQSDPPEIYNLSEYSTISAWPKKDVWELFKKGEL